MGQLGTTEHVNKCFEWACREAGELCGESMDMGLDYYQRVIEEHKDSIKRIMEG